MSLIIAYIAGKDGKYDQRLHIDEYSKKEHRGKIKCSYGHDLIAKKGEKKVHHFAHRKKATNDDCSRLTGLWHLGWQYRLEDKYLEIRIKKEGKLHIADALCNNRVIEFQKSVIGKDVIKQREKFYGKKLVWIFCCEMVDIVVERQEDDLIEF